MREMDKAPGQLRGQSPPLIDAKSKNWAKLECFFQQRSEKCLNAGIQNSPHDRSRARGITVYHRGDHAQSGVRPEFSAAEDSSTSDSTRTRSARRSNPQRMSVASPLTICAPLAHDPARATWATPS